MLEAFDWITTMQTGIFSGEPAVVVLSLGGEKSVTVNNAVENLTKIGIVVVAAAGNTYGNDACLKSPASSSFAITVGATRKVTANTRLW